MTPPQIEFFKMSAAGNDFILFDNRAGTLGRDDFPGLVRRLCTRALSVGADGVILLEPSSVAHVRASFFNPDGKPTFCGNGARCASRLAYLKGIAPARMTVETSVMVHRAEVKGVQVSFEIRRTSTIPWRSRRGGRRSAALTSTPGSPISSCSGRLPRRNRSKTWAGP